MNSAFPDIRTFRHSGAVVGGQSDKEWLGGGGVQEFGGSSSQADGCEVVATETQSNDPTLLSKVQQPQETILKKRNEICLHKFYASTLGYPPSEGLLIQPSIFR